MSYRIIKYTSIILASVCIVAEISAAEITASPTKSYSFSYKSGGGISPSISALLGEYNSVRQARFEKCTSKETYTCATDTPLSYVGPTGSDTINGESVYHKFSGFNKTEIKNYTGEVRVEGSGAYEAEIRVAWTCPPGFSASLTSTGSDKKLECKMVELNSCAADGNPINIGTGEKFEREIDFSTPDSILSVERFYVNQFANWKLASEPGLTYIPHGGAVEGGTEYATPVKYTRPVTTPEGDTMEDYYVYIPIKYLNPNPNPIVYISLNSRRHKFEKIGSNYVGEGIAGKNHSLIELSPVNSSEPKWKYTSGNGDVLYFFENGKLLRKEFVNGGFVTYAYTDNKLTSVIDHKSRSLNYTYDVSSRLVAIGLPDTQSIIYEYGEDEKLADYYLLKKVIWPNGESITYLYNETNNIIGSTYTSKMLTGKVDSLGNRIGTYKYSGGKAISTEGALGSFKRTMTFYPSYTDVKDGLNSNRRYVFNATSADGIRLLTSTNQPAGSGCAAATESATYYSDGLKKTETNFNGHKTQFAYDAARALETVRVEGVPKSNSTDYLPANTTLVAGARKITTQWHSQYRKPVTKAEPKLITTFIYNGDADPFNGGQLANCAPVALPLLCRKVQQATTDANGASGLNASLDNAIAARHEFYTYNARGQQLTFARAATGTQDEVREYYETTTTEWTLGDLKKITNALGQATEFVRYDPNGRLLQMIDPNGVETMFAYDARGRLLTQTVASATTTHIYDLNGNRIGSELPNGVLYTYHYDLAKRLITVENSLGEKINYEYDVENNLRYERITNTSNTQTYVKQYVYDALSRVQNALNSNNQGSTYLYDAKGNLTGEMDANTRSTSHTIDPLDRLTRTTDALNGKTDFIYDTQGNLIQVKDARNNSTTYLYNAFGDLVLQTSPDTGTTTFIYDELGNRTNSTDARGVVVNYGYDALNRLTSVEYPAASTENITYSYDSTTNGNYGVGRLTGIDTAAVQIDFEYNYQGLITKKYTQVANTFSSTEYGYDAAGLLTSVTYPSGREVHYQLDTLGRISGITTKANSSAPSQTLIGTVGYLPFGPANAYTYGNGLSHSQTYDQDYRLTEINIGGILSRTYGYDPVNNITSIVNGLNTANDQTFGYDALNRLMTASGGYGALGYTYDAVGNRLTETRNSVVDSYSYSSTSNKLNAITRAVGNRNFAYDTAGNPTQRTADDNSNQTFNFNNANRLIDVSVNNALAASYTYNPLGQRVVKTLANGSKEIYHYDEAGQLIVVTDGAGATLREYIYWNNQQVALVSNGNIYYIHNDHLNTPQVVTDANQQVVWMVDYEPFGKLAANQTNSIELYSRFPGQYLDQETGLYYNYFRDYDPSIGRYIESDPIGLMGGINTYGYVEGSPLVDGDFFGLSSDNSWNNFQSAFSGRGLNSSQLSGLYNQNNLNNWANTGNHNWTPGFANSPIMSGIGGVIDIANAAINSSCFFNALQIQDAINQAIQDAANQSSSCGDTFWQVSIQIAKPTGCIQDYAINIANNSSVWSPIAYSPVNNAPWFVHRGRR